MIDYESEELITLEQARGLFPEACRPQMSTLYRWSNVKQGCFGQVLETVRIGRFKMTSREAVRRFIESLTRPQPGQVVESSAIPIWRRSNAAEEEAELRRRGLMSG